VCTKPVLQDGCNYLYAAGPIITPFGDYYIERGYVGVDITVAGKDYRIVNTHLEVKDPPTPPILQAAQAQELIATLAATTPPEKSLVVMGDTNSSPVDPIGGPCSQFMQSGYTVVCGHYARERFQASPVANWRIFPINSRICMSGLT
jgi:hypothetical protein